MTSKPSPKSKLKGKTAMPDGLRVLSDITEEPWSYDFFALARRLEASHDGPGFGRTKRPSEDPVRFGQHASMAFSPRSVHGIKNTEVGPVIKLLFSGMFGPNGAMPYHLTEWATDRRMHKSDTSLEDFADIFHHRFFSLFYRAWADSDPVVALDAKDHDDVFKKYVGAIGGVFESDSDQFLDIGRRFYMSHVGTSASRPESLERVLADYFGTNVDIVEYIGSWLDIGDDDRVSLDNAELGSGQILGQSVFSRSGTFEIVVGPLSEAEFNEFLPGQKSAELLTEIVIALVGLDFAWRVRLLRAGDTVQSASLGGQSRLGYDAWMVDPEAGIKTRDDLVLTDAHYGTPH